MKSLVLLLVAAASTFAFADGNTATAAAKASVKLYAPITLLKTQDLDFGAIVVDDLGQPSSVNFDPNSLAMTYTGCAALKGAGALGHQAAWFHYMKDAALGVSITLPTTVALSGGIGGDVTLTPAKSGDQPCYWWPDQAGISKGHFDLAGKLDIPAGAFGEKSGQVSVTVAYN